MKKQKPYWEMNVDELAEATREFDAPDDHLRATKATPAERAKLRRWQRKRSAARARLTLSLEKHLIERTDHFAARRGISFSDVVSVALRDLMRKKSA